jgi:hypothetical protein
MSGAVPPAGLADGVAVVLPLLGEDYVQARQDARQNLDRHPNDILAAFCSG